MSIYEHTYEDDFPKISDHFFEDFIKFTKSCPKPDKRSYHFQKFPKVVNISEVNRRFPRKKRQCFDHEATHLSTFY